MRDTSKAREAANSRFVEQARFLLPDAPPETIDTAADALRRAFMAEIGQKSAASRRKRKAQRLRALADQLEGAADQTAAQALAAHYGLEIDWSRSCACCGAPAVDGKCQAANACPECVR